MKEITKDLIYQLIHFAIMIWLILSGCNSWIIFVALYISGLGVSILAAIAIEEI